MIILVKSSALELAKLDNQSKTVMYDPLIAQIVTLHHYITHFDVFMLLLIFCSAWKFFCLTNRTIYFSEPKLSVCKSAMRIYFNTYDS